MGRALLERVDPVGRDPERLVEPADLDDDRAGRSATGSRSCDSVPVRASIAISEQQYHARAMAFPDLTALKDFAGWKAARGRRAPSGRRSDAEGLRAAYLDAAQARAVRSGRDGDRVGEPHGSTASSPRASCAARTADRAAGGMDWPLHGLTMIGLNRLDDLQACVEAVCRDGVQGDLIEAGTWRGGASILMRATLDSLGETESHGVRRGLVPGLPDRRRDRRPQRRPTSSPSRPTRCASSFARFGLDAGRRSSSRGSSNRRCPRSATGGGPIARLDGDTYAATRAALDALYPQLAVGGYLIVDDFGVMERHECRRAVEEFRAQHGIAEPFEEVDWTCVRWRRESAAPIEVPAAPPPPASRAQARPRVARPAGPDRPRARPRVRGRPAARAPARAIVVAAWVGRGR